MKKFLFSFGLMLTMVSVALPTPARAQFTLLPQAPEGVDCRQLLEKYELDGEIPSRKQIVEEQTSQVVNDYQNLSNDSALFADCNSDNPVNPEACQELQEAQQAAEQAQQQVDQAGEGDDQAALLGCAIKTGRVSLQMVPFFITYMANFLLAMSGIVSVLFIVVGGYFYIYGGLTDQKERGKKYLVNALVGLTLAILSWSIVVFIINAITS